MRTTCCLAAGLIAMASAAGAAQAKPLVYQCSYSAPSPRGGIVGPLYLEVDAAAGKARAIDPVIKHAYGKPIAVKIYVDNAKRTTFNWQVAGLEGRENGLHTRLAPLRYSVTLLKPSLRLVAYTRFNGADNSFSGQGNCRLK